MWSSGSSATGSLQICHCWSPRKQPTTWARSLATTTWWAPAARAAGAFAAATTTQRSRTAPTSGAAPTTPRSEPSKPSSATNAYFCATSGGSCSSAINTATAIAKSRPEPPLRSPLGAKFTVIRRLGQANPRDKNAARTRSRLSRHTSSGWPTMVNPGSPTPTCTSTSTQRPTTPNNVVERTEANITTSFQQYCATGPSPVRIRRR